MASGWRACEFLRFLRMIQSPVRTSAPKPITPPITPPTIAPILEEPLPLDPLVPGVEVEVEVVLVVDPPPVTVPVVDGPAEEEGATLVVEVVLKFQKPKSVSSWRRRFASDHITSFHNSRCHANTRRREDSPRGVVWKSQLAIRSTPMRLVRLTLGSQS